MSDWSDVQYNFVIGSTSQTIAIPESNWGSGANAGTTVYYTPPSMLPPVPAAVAEDDLAWLRERVTEIEEFSRIAA